jgi:AraC family transcriptional regulator of adaptative response/methylated-DNA-[protein]-cysteine methyltransferase
VSDAPFYGVTTTGVYCRKGCASRTPLAKNVRFFNDLQAARDAGFRACKRCRPDAATAIDERIVQACRLLDGEESLTLAQLGARVGLSPGHLQRRFTRAIGLSPRQYAQLTREERLRRVIRAAPSVTAALYDAGYGSSASAYAGASKRLGMTPTALRNGAPDEQIGYAIVDSALGRVLVAATSRGICRVDIGDRDSVLEKRLREAFASAAFARSDERLESATSRIVAYLANQGPWPLLPLDVRATAFQMRVWEALRTIKPGTTMEYGELARAIGSPAAARAVAQACASNPIALLIPCHRIVPAAGGAGGYRWGPKRKARLLEIERRA